MLEGEVWRIVPSVPFLMASSHGRVMIVPSTSEMPNGGERHCETTPRIGEWDGDRYLFCCRGKTYKVARLVCEAFNGLPPTDAHVAMHVDENSRNNHARNLAWGTQKQNLNAPGYLEFCRSRTGENNPFVKGRKARARR